MEDIVVFDALGPIYQYKEAKGKMENCIPLVFNLIEALHSKKLKEVGNDNAKKLLLGAQMEADYIRMEVIHPVATSYSVETLLRLRKKGIMPVVISGCVDETLGCTLDKVIENYAKEHGLDANPAEIIPYKNRISTLPLGQKSDPKTWQTAVYDNFGTNSRILFGYEDSLGNATALAEGLNCPGLHVVSVNEISSMPITLQMPFVLQYTPLIIRGTMQQHYETLIIKEK